MSRRRDGSRPKAAPHRPAAVMSGPPHLADYAKSIPMTMQALDAESVFENEAETRSSAAQPSGRRPIRSE